LIIHAPGIFTKPEVRHGLASQTDIFPTVMGLLRENYTQNTMGYDLFREKRPYAFFSQDYRLCAIDDRYLYVARKSGRESLYEHKNPQPVDLIDQFPWVADSMKHFSCSHLKTARWMIEKGLVGAQ
jgi:phosphoglycerol transferase MdoB-like AlkP superfamily enzyme